MPYGRVLSRSNAHLTHKRCRNMLINRLAGGRPIADRKTAITWLPSTMVVSRRRQLDYFCLAFDGRKRNFRISEVSLVAAWFRPLP